MWHWDEAHGAAPKAAARTAAHAAREAPAAPVEPVAAEGATSGAQPEAQADGDAAPAAGCDASAASCAAGGGGNVNMLSAALHLLSDFARSLTTLAESLVLMALARQGEGARGPPPAFVDAVAALCVCSFIGIGILAGAVKWLRAFRTYLRRERVAAPSGGPSPRRRRSAHGGARLLDGTTTASRPRPFSQAARGVLRLASLVARTLPRWSSVRESVSRSASGYRSPEAARPAPRSDSGGYRSGFRTL